MSGQQNNKRMERGYKINVRLLRHLLRHLKLAYYVKQSEYKFAGYLFFRIDNI